MKITKDNFSKLLDLLSLIKDVCNDADIRQGQLRQIVNNKTFMFECDLTSLLDNNDLVLPLLKTKLQLMKIFLDGNMNSDITFEVKDNKYIFYDDTSQLRFSVTESSQYLDNKYLNIDEKNNLLSLDTDQYMQFSLDKSALNKIKILTENLNVEDIMIDIEKKKASINIVSFNKLNDATLVKNIPVEHLDDKNYRITLSATPFKLDFTESLEVQVYKSNKQENRLITIVNTKLTDLDINIYIPGFLVNREEEQ